MASTAVFMSGPAQPVNVNSPATIINKCLIYQLSEFDRQMAMASSDMGLGRKVS
jgi:hypothetical protein